MVLWPMMLTSFYRPQKDGSLFVPGVEPQDSCMVMHEWTCTHATSELALQLPELAKHHSTETTILSVHDHIIKATVLFLLTVIETEIAQ